MFRRTQKKLVTLLTLGNILLLMLCVREYRSYDINDLNNSCYSNRSHGSSIVKVNDMPVIESSRMNQFLNEDAVSDHWHVVDDKKEGLFVFSAYYDEVLEPSPIVRVVAVGRKDNTQNWVYCSFTYEDDKDRRTSLTYGYLSTIYTRPRKHQYIAKWIKCMLPDDRIPSYVTIIPNKDDDNRHHVNYKIKVHYAPLNREAKNTINVCVRPIHKNYSNVTRLAEFIEMYRLLGVTHFTFFNLSMSSTVSTMLEMYKERGLVTVLNHDLSPRISILAEAQHATQQDCFLRSRGTFQYVILVDLDEFIVPRQHKTFQEMLHVIDKDDVSAFSFACIFYCTNFKSNSYAESYLFYKQYKENLDKEFSLDLVTQLKTLRANKPCYFPYKSKLIVKPWAINQAEVHEVIYSARGYLPLKVDPNLAMSHHYRWCSQDLINPLQNQRVKCPGFPYPEDDEFTHTFLDELTSKIMKVIKDLRRKL